MNDKKVYRIFEDELEEYYKKLIYKRRSSHKFDVEEENSTDSFENERYQSDYINNRNKLNVHIKYLIKEIKKNSITSI